MIGDEPSGQHDPTETLAKMIDHFDALARSSAHRDVFATVMERGQQCSRGHNHGYRHCPDGEAVLYGYTDSLGGRSNPSTLMLLQTALVYPSTQRPCPECESPATVDTAAKFVRLGKLLAIHVAWNVDSTSFDQESRPTKLACHSFDISPTIDMSGLFTRQKDRSQPTVTASLCGLLCKQGSRIDVGHYVAYIQHNDRWWRMDDHRAIDVRSISDAFDGGRYPVFLLYCIQGVVPKDPPASSKLCPEPTNARSEPSYCDPEPTNARSEPSYCDPEPTNARSVPSDCHSKPTERLTKARTLNPPEVPKPNRPVKAPNRSTHENSKFRHDLTFDRQAHLLLERPAVLIKNPANPKSLHDRVLQRYKTVHWAKDSRKSLIHTIAQPDDVRTTLARALVDLKDNMASSEPGTTAATLLEYLPNYFRDPTTWWHSDVIYLILESVASHTDQELRGHHALLHLHFRSDGAPYCLPEGTDITGRQRPWMCLPRGWLLRTTTDVISSCDNTHFIAIAIFGPQKLVVVYDGKEGWHDADGLWKVRKQPAKSGPDLISPVDLDRAVEIPFGLGSQVQSRTRTCCEWVAHGTE